MTMTQKPTLAVLGGDQRQISMARALASKGYRVLAWGLGRCADRLGEATLVSHWQEAIEGADAVVLPLPASADGVRVHCPLQEGDVLLRLTSLLDAMTGKLLLGGRLTESLRSIAEQKQIEVIDYFESEVLQIKNALPTAEGAIAIAMRELPVTVSGTDAAVIGYGRIGALLAQRLKALGASVTVYARRREQLAEAELGGHRVCRIVCRDGKSQLNDIKSDHRVIFNTVPVWLLTREVLERLPSDCILIDLASAPGGIDAAAARSLGLGYVWGTSLPGKCAPESAGVILAETLVDLLDEYSSLSGGVPPDRIDRIL